MLSPYLFNIFAEMAMRTALEGFDGGLRIGGRCISNLRYADDIVLFATSVEELQALVNRLHVAGLEFGLMVNVDKTKVLSMDDVVCNIRIGTEKLQQVDEFTYLGSLITKEGDCAKEIKLRLSKALGVGASLKRIWQSHDISIHTKIRLYKALIWPIALYGCESWTLKKVDERKLEAFEMKGLRMILRVSWTSKRTNDWVSDKAGVDRNILFTVRKRKMEYFGHLMRKEGECLEKQMIQGTLSGSRKRGRPRIRWFDNICEWMKMEAGSIMRMTSRRDEWRAAVHEAAKPRHGDG